jgi:hypothetical protein
VIKWFNLHSFALGVFNKEQESTYKEIWPLIVPVITCQTSHSCALSQLLQVNKAMKITVTQHEDELVESVGNKAKTIQKAVRVMSHMKDENWWKELAM